MLRWKSRPVGIFGVPIAAPPELAPQEQEKNALQRTLYLVIQ
jgi:hypothetical protein